MPVTEATSMDAIEFATYELAFHILPTVAEGEVPTAFATIKEHVTKNGGSIITEEAPARIDLAYDIEKYLEGKYRKFSSAYFGWVRFSAPASALEVITEEITSDVNVLRQLLLKLSKLEEQHTFKYHEAFESERQIETIDVAEAIAEAEAAGEKAAATDEVVAQKA